MDELLSPEPPVACSGAGADILGQHEVNAAHIRKARIALILVLGGLLTFGGSLAPPAVEAQHKLTPVRIGVLCAGLCLFPFLPSQPFISALERFGLTPGHTLAWDIGGVVASADQIDAEAKKLVARRPDLLLVWSGSAAAARAARDATQSIPIVLMAVSNVVELGLVDNLRRPGGNISGTTVPLFDLTLKQLQMLKEINPKLRHLLVVQGDLDPGERQMVDRLRGMAAALGFPDGISFTSPEEIEKTLITTRRATAGILALGNMPHVIDRRVRALSLDQKMPLITPWRTWERGGSTTLIAYGPHFPSVAERTASIIDRVLKGARVGDIPVEEPTRYELIIDGVMAKALGLRIPPTVRARADEVLE
jgi:putative ABC transport system substrate-binding protein